MLLIISPSKKNARAVSDTFHHMSILSYGATPHEGLSEISGLYRAVLILHPESFPDVIDYVSRLKSYNSALPIFALTERPPALIYSELFDGIFTRHTFTPALAEKIISYADENRLARIGDYFLAGFDASRNLVGVNYFYTKIKLTKTEAMILRYLIRSYPVPQSAENILKYAFRQARAPEASSIRTHMSLMNKKFSETIGRRMIVNEPGEGYRILTPELSKIS